VAHGGPSHAGVRLSASDSDLESYSESGPAGAVTEPGASGRYRDCQAARPGPHCGSLTRIRARATLRVAATAGPAA
jgi:hypothetical protein